MGLFVQFAEWAAEDGDEWQPKQWLVCCSVAPPGKQCIEAGFSRKKDAELAMESLNKLAVDWDSTEEELRHQLRAIGGREVLRKAACEHLQW